MESRSERIERLLVALLLQSMKNASKKDKAMQLNIAGFSNIEIAEFLGTSPQAIGQYLYETRKIRPSRARR